MVSFVIAIALSAAGAERPVALVLSAKGAVEVRPAEGEPLAAARGMLLYPGDRLSVPDGGEAVVVFRDGGARERVRPGAEATVGAKGCTPPGAVERREGGEDQAGRPQPAGRS